MGFSFFWVCRDCGHEYTNFYAITRYCPKCKKLDFQPVPVGPFMFVYIVIAGVFVLVGLVKCFWTYFVK